MIYYIEDDSNIRDLVVYTLETTGMEACGFEDGESMFRALRETVDRPELILLDIMLPGDDGVTILRKLRSNPETREIPIIMATARGDEYDKVRALDLGADDYVTKPYAMMELVSRVKAVLRRAEKKLAGTGRKHSSDEIAECGRIHMDNRRHKVLVDGEEVALTLKEYELLRKLLLNQESVLTREQILTDVWGYEFDGETRTVDVHVRMLRTKLGRAGNQIETVRGVGYRLCS